MENAVEDPIHHSNMIGTVSELLPDIDKVLGRGGEPRSEEMRDMQIDLGIGLEKFLRIVGNIKDRILSRNHIRRGVRLQEHRNFTKDTAWRLDPRDPDPVAFDLDSSTLEKVDLSKFFPLRNQGSPCIQ